MDWDKFGLPNPDDAAERFAMAVLEVAEIAVVWAIAIGSYKLLDRIRLGFKPREFWQWLQTPEGNFADYLARKQRKDDGTAADGG